MIQSWFAPHDAPVRTGRSGAAWRSVLLPLDGSEPPGWAVARARPFLELPDLSFTLLRVIECREDRANSLAYQMDSRHREACDALSKARTEFPDLPGALSADVRFGDPATEILREIAEGDHDLAILDTSGRAGFDRSRIGRVAQRVLRSSPIPLLFFPPPRDPDEAPEAARLRRILVTLDGSRAAEEILPATETLALALGSEIHLLRVVSPGRKGEADRPFAAESLDRWNRVLASRGIPSRTHVRAGDPAQAALDLVREFELDSIALATHARTGLAHAAYGGVARELMRESRVPILTQCVLRRRLPLPASALEHRHVGVERA